MGKINWGRVVLGGVLWSVVYNMLVAVWIPFFLRIGWAPALEKLLGRPFHTTPEWIVFFLVLSLIAGIFSIWFYAAIRPRYGPGPKTAAYAGLALWLSVKLLPTLAWGWLLELPTRLVALDVVAGLVFIVAATLVGAWPYKE